MRKQRPALRREGSSWKFAARASCNADAWRGMLVKAHASETHGGSRQDGVREGVHAASDAGAAILIRLLPTANTRQLQQKSDVGSNLTGSRRYAVSLAPHDQQTGTLWT